MAFLDTNTDMSNFQDVASGGGINLFNHVGNTSGNITLPKDKITTAHFTGNHTVTLPTVSSTKQEQCILDFTTVNASYPTITNTNIKYLNGLAPSYYTGTGSVLTVTGASNATPIEITVTSHGYETGDVVLIASVGGNTNANGTFVITKTGTNTFTLNGSAGNSNYTSGGTSTKYVTRNRFTFTSILGMNNWEVKCDYFGGSINTYSQGTLASNGTLGGSSFAVGMTNSDTNTYQAFDNNSGTYFRTGGVGTGLIVYNPTPVRVSQISFTNVPAYTGSGYDMPTGLTMEGSNDGTNYTLIKNISNSNKTLDATWTDTVSATVFYKYRRYTCTSLSGAGYFGCEQFTESGHYIAL